MMTRKSFFWPVLVGVLVLGGGWQIIANHENESQVTAGDHSLAATGALLSTAGVQKKDDETAMKSFMRQKLAASNDILEGLCTDQLEMVEAGAEVLLKMSREERWRASNDMLYRRYSTEFTDAVTDMKEKAKAQSIDGTSLAWINATMKCLKCHEWVRNTVIADNTVGPSKPH